jgi:hypothetical protein
VWNVTPWGTISALRCRVFVIGPFAFQRITQCSRKHIETCSRPCRPALGRLPKSKWADFGQHGVTIGLRLENYLQKAHLPRSLAQCRQYLQFLHAWQGSAPMHVAENRSLLRFSQPLALIFDNNWLPRYGCTQEPQVLNNRKSEMES